MGVLCFVYLIASLRTNVMFFIIFLTLVIAFGILSGAYWNLAKGTPSATAYAGKLEIVRGRVLALSSPELVANLLHSTGCGGIFVRDLVRATVFLSDFDMEG